jgi:hypothetical protein
MAITKDLNKRTLGTIKGKINEFGARINGTKKVAYTSSTTIRSIVRFIAKVIKIFF